MKYTKYKKMLAKKRIRDINISSNAAEYSRQRYLSGKRGKHFKGRDKLFGMKRRQMPIRQQKPQIVGGENAHT